MEINKKDLLPLSFLKKSPYTGSFRGIRYRIEKQEEGEENPSWSTPGRSPMPFRIRRRKRRKRKVFLFPK